MKCVIDTSPIGWLNKIGRIDLLKDIYTTLYTTPAVKMQLQNFTVSQMFVDELVIHPEIDSSQHRFNKLVRRWTRKLNHKDVADIEVLVTHKFFALDSD